MIYQATVFAFGEDTIRIVVNPDGKPCFVAEDVRKALGHANPTRSVPGAASRGAERCLVAGLDRCDHVTIISEVETYRLVANAKTDRRDELLEWLISEITPAIHRRREYVRSGIRYHEYDDILHWYIDTVEMVNGAYCPMEQVYPNYLRWCRASKISAASRATLAKSLADLGVDVKKAGHLFGVAIRDVPDNTSRSDFLKLDLSMEARRIKDSFEKVRVEELQEANKLARQVVVETNAKLREIAGVGDTGNVVRFPLLSDA